MEILAHPNPALKQRAADIDPTTDKELVRLVRSMAKAMYDAPGVGLAATQVGVLKRVIVMDLDDELIALCNPEITAVSDETETEEEGCLSLPGITIPIERPLRCTCSGVNIKGEPVTINAEGYFARVLQHETDHLNGLLMLDRATPEERLAAIRRYHEASDAR